MSTKLIVSGRQSKRRNEAMLLRRPCETYLFHRSRQERHWGQTDPGAKCQIRSGPDGWQSLMISRLWDPSSERGGPRYHKQNFVYETLSAKVDGSKGSTRGLSISSIIDTDGMSKHAQRSLSHTTALQLLYSHPPLRPAIPTGQQYGGGQ